MKKLLLVLPLFFLFLPGCFVSKTPVYTLSPVDQNKKWLMGSEYTKMEINNVIVNLAWEDQESGSIRFFVTIINYSSHDLLIAPELFSIQVIKSEHDTSETIKYLAVDPEIKIIRLKEEVEKEKASFMSYSGNSALLSFIDLIGDVTLSSTRTEEEIEEDRINDSEREYDYQEGKQLHESRLEKLEARRELYESSLLRKTHLQPGESLSGTVYFELIRDASWLRLNIPVEMRNFRFVFKQQKITESRPGKI